MKDLTPDRSTLDPIEIASTDEIQALQLERMKWSLHHAYDNVEMYHERFDEAGVHPDDLKSLSDLSKFPSPIKTIYAIIIPLGFLLYHVIRLHGFMRLLEPLAKLQSLGIPKTM